MDNRGLLLGILGFSAIFYFAVWGWLYLINKNLIELRKDIFKKVDEESDELNKDAASIKRRQTWSKKRELKAADKKKIDDRVTKIIKGK